jgi:putative transcriptional regulator
MPKKTAADAEMLTFQADLMEAVRDMKAGRAARVTHVKLSAAANARAKTGVSQAQFATLLGVSARTLQNWEQGRTQPSGAAQTLLEVASRHPDVLRELTA